MVYQRKLLALGVLSALLATETQAQGLLEEVVVTARKRTETLSDSPVSVRAFTESEIRATGIQTPQDFVDLTPNVTLVQTQSTGNSFLNIRGISSSRNSELAAAILIDGVLLSNPTQLNQQLFDIEQIEVLRGPQGALYGRNAIGGAITIVTKQPGEETEAEIRVGAESAPGYSVKGYVGGPLNDDGSIKYRLAGSYIDLDGYLDNEYLNQEADPYEDTSFRGRLNWDVSDNLTTDFRVSYSKLETQAFYFVIDAEADDVDIPIQVNNPGNNEREFTSASFKFDWETDAFTVTGITSYDDVTELSSGDNFNFLPREAEFNFFNNDPFGEFIKFLTGDEFTDLSQNQFLEVESISQEIRLTSNNDTGLQWIAGAYVIATDRYISTGGQIDRGLGVFDVEKNFRPQIFIDAADGVVDDPSPQLGVLADEQDNFAWAVFGQLAYDINDYWEVALSIRYDEDERENTTLTPPEYNVPFNPEIVFGEVRKETWDALQPKFTVRYRPNEDWMLYADASRGFRSGGFNQTGVGSAVTYPGIEDLFDEQIADTYEVGAKGTMLDGKLRLSAAAYHTTLEGAYFFFYDAPTNTQNLGSIDEVEYTGLEIEGSALLGDYVTLNFGLGLTDSEITESPTEDWLGNQAPLVSEVTGNIGLQFRAPIGDDKEFFIRGDYQYLGETWWEPNNDSSRSGVNLLDARMGIEDLDNWAVTLWVRNAGDKEYNTEYSPGPAPGFNFLWRAQPVRYGIELTKWF
ncbi:TonB-dependent receptor [Luminiphilus syltensis NOR5-1B]|uniref:TonB-dependent receptor n=1 Tax=Luminiphilus syltensis NOR5-1B TaxID=565045 RepID=B8KSF9_9GAMM|nr:TonB-dependent receptor [Luminiphilus syltensis]EED36878.1 TonB-dependent receptor [Luminiphilus syltensis NOR5-1B]